MKPTIKATKDYIMFKKFLDNRDLSKGHLFKLRWAIEKKDLLHLNPIIVNERMEVIEGQHRLEVARQLEKPIYYIVSDDCDCEDLIALNNNSRAWKLEDYLDYWIKLGKQDYIDVKELTESVGTNLSNMLTLVSDSGAYSKVIDDFRSGRFQLKLTTEIQAGVDNYKEIIEEWHNKTGLNKNRLGGKSFMRAVKIITEAFPFNTRWVEKLKEHVYNLPTKASTRDYAQIIVDQHNKNLRRERLVIIDTRSLFKIKIEDEIESNYL